MFIKIPSKLAKCSEELFTVAFTCFVLTPLVIVYWHSTWKLCDIYLATDEPSASAVISFVIGTGGQLFFMFFQDAFGRAFHVEGHKAVNFLTSVIYRALIAAVCVNFWRGMWTFSYLLSGNVTANVMHVILNSLIAMLMGAFKNTLGVPFATPTAAAAGDQQNAFAFQTFFRWKVRVLVSSETFGQLILKHNHTLRKRTEAENSYSTVWFHCSCCRCRFSCGKTHGAWWTLPLKANE